MSDCIAGFLMVAQTCICIGLFYACPLVSMTNLCVCPLQHISICDYLISIMPNVADRIKITEANVKITHIAFKRQQHHFLLRAI